ncbi:hypothetical protein HY384_03035 [Candidatus Daviesbacteria bacterium]|nr:hypothetical protein [Candidatus Daviesbacteria bacterium]
MLPQENTQPNSQTPPIGNFFTRLPENKKKPVIVLGIVLTLLFLLFSIILFSRGGKNSSQPQKLVTQSPDLLQEYNTKKDGTYYSSAISPALKNPPKVSFKYISTAQIPKLQNSAPSFKLANNLSEFEAIEIGKKFGISAKPNLIGVGNFHFYEPGKKVDLVVYRKSGAFVATFLNNLNEATPSALAIKINTDADAINLAKDYLSKLNLWEETLEFPMGGNIYPKNPTVYQRQSQPNTYFVEFHRGWKILPILNQVGLLNSPLRDQLSDPKKFLAEDSDISYSSDGLTSFQRADQFNTVTIGLTKSGKVNYLQYYIRKITGQSQTNLKSYEGALAELKSGSGIGVLVYPVAQRAGSDTTVDYTSDQWQGLFPSGEALSDEAVVDDVQLAYEEKLITEPQAVMLPVYLFRGKAPLKGGVVVNFVALVDARSQ